MWEVLGINHALGIVNGFNTSKSTIFSMAGCVIVLLAPA
jgi:hypothetical protein